MNDKFLVIEGRVLGGHQISDLGLFVPYKKEVVVPQDRAMWSRDLTDAFQKKQVVKKRVVSGHDLPTTIQKPVTQVKPSPQKKFTVPRSLEERSEITSAQVDAVLQKSIEENEKLREMNSSLMEATNRLLEQQKELVEKLSEFMDRPQAVIGIPTLAQNQSIDHVEDDIPTFIPSTIRTGNAKVGDVSVTEGQATSSSKDEDALKALRAKKGKK